MFSETFQEFLRGVQGVLEAFREYSMGIRGFRGIPGGFSGALGALWGFRGVPGSFKDFRGQGTFQKVSRGVIYVHMDVAGSFRGVPGAFLGTLKLCRSIPRVP